VSVVTLVVVLTAAILAVLAVVGVVVFGVYRRRYRAAMEPLAAEFEAESVLRAWEKGVYRERPRPAIRRSATTGGSP
jgi:Tfp pilus assembly protein PilX